MRGESDAGTVIDSVAGRFESRGLKTLDFSDRIPGLPIVVRGDADPALVHHVKRALLALSYDDLESRKIMKDKTLLFRCISKDKTLLFRCISKENGELCIGFG